MASFLACQTAACSSSLEIMVKRTGTSAQQCINKISISLFLHQVVQQGIFGQATLWSAEKMRDGQREKVARPVHGKTARGGLPQKRLEEDLC